LDNSAVNDPLTDCLLMVCKHHGRPTSRENLTNGLPLPNGQLGPSILERAAKRIDMSVKILNRSLTELNPNLFPAILLLKQEQNANQSCVIYEYNSQTQTALIAYPDLPNSLITISTTELTEQYSETVIYIRPEFKLVKQDSQLKENPLHWFWGVIKDNRSLYRDILLASIFINLFALAMPLFVMNVYDRVVPNHATETLWVLAIGIGIIMSVELLLKLLRSWFVDLGANRADIRISSEILEKILSMKLENRPVSSGSFVSNIQSFESIRNFFGSLTVVALIDLPFVLLFALIITLINPILVIPIAIGGILILVYALIAQKKMHRLSLDSMYASAMRNSTLYESVSNLESIKSFNIENRSQNNWEKTTIFLTQNTAKMRLLSSSITQGALWVQHMVGVTVIIIGVYLIIKGEISQGALIASYMLSARAMSPISHTAGLLSQYHYAATAYETLDEIMEKESERPHDKSYFSPVAVRGEIEFKGVSFQYPNSNLPALHDISFTIHSGEHVAILGRNGSGKTSLYKLILGLYQPEAGFVSIDGVDLKNFEPSLLRNHIGYIPQDTALFSGTLKENVCIAAPNATDEQILHAIHVCGLDTLVHNHSEGLELQIGENGQNLSGGQKQAITLARAIINEPSIYLFDEPTGSLDYNSKVNFHKNIKEISEGKTLLTITHNINLISFATRIIILDAGKIVADGPKDSVLEALRKGRIGGVS